MYCFSCSEPEYIEPNFQVSFSPLDFTDMVSPDDSTIFDSALGTSGNDIIQPSSAPTLHNRSTDPLLSVEETPAAEVGLDADPPASNQTMAAPLEAPTAPNIIEGTLLVEQLVRREYKLVVKGQLQIKVLCNP
jgi:hypothetical protein